ncbi:ABC transporter substrate-binding protein [Streptomyces agglomeratus]|uniref:ABC transporter substrate-binding protein n=1 Tax=Streptomyces agglomeratus TaxID=285458 RepID=A0A1E5P7H5_9ACTN|nr:sugar ABC transporter substrate-binding protein [Streptomyces agglomeratus]OEJ25482.1 ABC transporter substrate-binding protein [Streptomyces agglomeratus]OEJ40479.1 ABC transporter substrate-binding protein [Streptomyces agglomeratus]OEJ45141.1 ABC transporter substrate-binding protein [Streptomyces agglomeratus]OEJ53030.1 ABC transporter substrate-binding protein [Streptomyces agglomeratus]OEJ60366.1 ABC transporter substrate-binding protein [Streptomyces agglomeratus]
MSPSWNRTSPLIVGAATALAVLTACGGSGTAEKKSAAPGSDGKPVSITFWGWTKGSKEVVDAFNASHEDIRVTYEEIPSGNAGGYAKISNAVKAGNAPDLVSIEYPMLPEFVSQGAVQDISGHLSDDVKRKFLPQAVELTTLGGKNWAVPFDASPQALYYRKDLFEKYGVEVPRTWAEFREAAGKVRKADKKARIGTFFPDDPTTFQAMAWQAGAQWFKAEGDTWKVDTTDAATKKVSAYWQGLLDDDLIRNNASFSPEWTNSLKSGGTIGYLGASWGAGVLSATLPEQSGKWAVAPMPSWDGKPASGMLGGSTFAVTKDSEKTGAAVEFARWMTTTEAGVRARISSGTSSAFPAAAELRPAARAAFDAKFYGGQDIYRVFEDAGASISPNWAWGPSTGTTNTVIKDQFGKVTNGGATIADAVEAGHEATVSELRKRGLKVEG